MGYSWHTFNIQYIFDKQLTNFQQIPGILLRSNAQEGWVGAKEKKGNQLVQQSPYHEEAH
jgi:hypothetical protein